MLLSGCGDWLNKGVEHVRCIFLWLLNVSQLFRRQISNDLVVLLVNSLFLSILFSFHHFTLRFVLLRGFLFSHFRNLVKLRSIFSFHLLLLLHLILLIQLRILLDHLHNLFFLCHRSSSCLLLFLLADWLPYVLIGRLIPCYMSCLRSPGFLLFRPLLLLLLSKQLLLKQVLLIWTQLFFIWSRLLLQLHMLL